MRKHHMPATNAHWTPHAIQQCYLQIVTMQQQNRTYDMNLLTTSQPINLLSQEQNPRKHNNMKNMLLLFFTTTLSSSHARVPQNKITKKSVEPIR